MSVVLGTATPGGGFPVYGDAVAGTLNEVDPSLGVVTRNTKGSTENVPLLETGQLDLALVQGEVAYEALHGVGRAPADLKIFAAMYSTPGMFVVRGDSPARGIDDLRGQPVVFGARGSGLVILARYVLDGLGLDQASDFEPIYLDRAGDGPAMVLDGRAAALWGGGIGWPGFTAVTTAGGRLLPPDADGVRRIQARHAFLKALTVPAGAYPGQREPIVSVGSWSFIRRGRSWTTSSSTGSPARFTPAPPRWRHGCHRPPRRPPRTPPRLPPAVTSFIPASDASSTSWDSPECAPA
jgi:uncharacterized protein